MRRAAMAAGCVLSACLLVPARAFQVVPAQIHQESPWWVAFGLGEGELKTDSDQQQGSRVATFALGFAGGHRVGDRARVGLHVNGWLLQASNLQDPTVGESVSTVNGILDFFPSWKSRLFVRGGAGLALYNNNRPTGSNGSGPAWEAGGGYEIPIRGSIRLVPMVEYSAGGLGDVHNPPAPITGRRYSVIEFKLAAVCNFGGRKKR